MVARAVFEAIEPYTLWSSIYNKLMSNNQASRSHCIERITLTSCSTIETVFTATIVDFEHFPDSR